MRKFLLTFVVLVAGAMSAWAEGVAKIGDVSYATLAYAVSEAENGATITVQSDVTLDATLVVPAGKTITLDLNGKTISQEKFCSASYEMILNKGNLTITGNGKLSFKDTSAGDPSFGWGSYTLRNVGTLVVENGTIIEHLGEQPFATHMICAIFQYSGSTTINGGTISTPYYRSVRLWKGDMTINGGTFEGQVWVQSVDDSAVLTINGGTFAPCGRDGSSVFVGNVTTGGVHHTAGFSVTGGTFTTKIGCSDAEKLTGDRITGGTFSAAAVASLQGTNLLAEGAELGEPGADGYCTVVSPSDILVINSLEDFIAFRDAVNADNADNSFKGKIVRLNTDIDLRSLDWSESIGKDCGHPFKGVFDGNDKTINYLKTYSDEFALSRNYTGLFGVISGNAVIKDLVLENVSITLNCEGQYVGAVVAYANTEAGIIENVKILVGGEIPFLKVGASDVEGVGSIVGYAAQSGSLKISECEVKGKEGKIGTIIGAEYVGGLIGYASSGVIIDGNTVEYLEVHGTSSVGAIAGFMKAGGEVVNNTINNVQVLGGNSDVIAGTIEGKVTIEGTQIKGVAINGNEKKIPVSTAAKVDNAYYPTLKDAATDGKGKAFEVELFGEHTLADDVSYEHTNTVTVKGDLTYTRNLTGNWNPIYFPFDYKFDTSVYTLAEFVDGEGATLTLRLVENGELKANTPYVVRPNDGEAKVLSVKLDGSTLVRAEVEELKLGEEEDFVLLGNNETVNGSDLRLMLEKKYGDPKFHTPRVVGSKDGSWGILGNQTNLKPYRLILAGPATVENGQKAISMRILDGTTVVEEVVLDAQEAEAIFDLMGRRVETMTKGEIYIVNGKKVIF